MDQPVPIYSKGDLDRMIAREFPPESNDEVRAILGRYGQESWHCEVLRVRMACLKGAAGKLTDLSLLVDLACRDYRDVLAAAEYPMYVRADSPEAERRAIESDWSQFQQWLGRR